MSRPVVIGALAERDIREARAWFDGQEPGLGDQFFERVKGRPTAVLRLPSR